MQDADRQAFLELRQAFVGGLGARLAQIRGPDPQLRDQALHKLAGAAGAYELDDLGELARAVQAAARGRDAAAVQAGIDVLAAQVAALQRAA